MAPILLQMEYFEATTKRPVFSQQTFFLNTYRILNKMKLPPPHHFLGAYQYWSENNAIDIEIEALDNNQPPTPTDWDFQD